MTEVTTPQQRLRIRFSKGEALKYISHLDLARTWERVFRRAGLPVAYSQGFNPRPRFQIAAALPVGVTGRAELLDVWLDRAWSPDDLGAQIKPVLPSGLDVIDLAEVTLREPSLQSQLRTADYSAVVRSDEPVEAIRTRIQALLDRPTIPRQRRHKGRWQSYDLRPLVRRLTVHPAPDGARVLRMRLQASPQGAGRPSEVLDALGLTLAPYSIERTNLSFELDK
jgi:radical SAM-linked protein